MTSEKNNIPKGWIKTNLENISTIILGQSPPSSTYNKEKKGLPFFQGKAEFGQLYPTARIWCNSPKKIAEKDDILISVRAPVGSTNISAGTCCIGRGLSAIRVSEVAYMMYVFYHLRHLENHISQKGTGTTFKAITGKQLSSIQISLPPLNEQRRIVAKIESIFAQIDAAKERLLRLQDKVRSGQESLIDLKNSVLKQAFEGRLVPQDPSDEPAEFLLKKLHGDSNQKLIFEKDGLPNGWIKTNLENISIIILGQSPQSSTYNKERNGLPFFQGKAEFGEIHPTARVWCDSPKKTAEKDDILISVRAPVGSTNISAGTCCIGRGLSAIQVSEAAYMMYVFYHLRHLENHISQKGTGTTFKAITGQQLRSIQLVLPPIVEQHRIVAKLESIFGKIDAVERSVAETLTKMDLFKKSVLKHAFEGKLVPQDPNDEPASVLLERIKAEKLIYEDKKPAKGRTKNGK